MNWNAIWIDEEPDENDPGLAFGLFRMDRVYAAEQTAGGLLDGKILIFFCRRSLWALLGGARRCNGKKYEQQSRYHATEVF